MSTIQMQFDNFMDYHFDQKISSGVVLAVSGGADSVALLYLASKWSVKNKIRLVVLTVDHQLRRESFVEVEFVQQIASNLGHECIKLLWQHEQQLKSSIQLKARIARYEMMTSKCYEIGIRCILTAHHYDDFLENYYMRKTKSGLLALSNSYSTFYNNIYILRPLFDIKKIRLINHLRAHEIEWLEDPSNDSHIYERNRVRKEIAFFSKETKKSLEDEANTADVNSKDLNNEFIRSIGDHVKFSNLGFALIDLDAYIKLDHSIAVYLMQFVLTSVSGQLYIPRYRSIQILIFGFFCFPFESLVRSYLVL